MSDSDREPDVDDTFQYHMPQGVEMETVDQDAAAPSNLDNDEGVEVVEDAVVPSYYRIGVAALGGFVAGNLVPHLGKPLFYLSLSSAITLPTLARYGFINYTNKGQDMIEDLKEYVSPEGFEDIKDRCVKYVKDNMFTTLLFTSTFFLGLNRYYRSVRKRR